MSTVVGRLGGDALEAFLDVLDMGLWLVDTEDRVLFLNSWFERVWGQKIADLMARPLPHFEPLIHPEDYAAIQASLARARRGRETTFDWRVQGENGWHRLRSVARPIFTAGALVGVGGWTYDVTDEEARLAELRNMPRLSRE